jgi:hypothetical protein
MKGCSVKAQHSFILPVPSAGPVHRKVLNVSLNNMPSGGFEAVLIEKFIRGDFTKMSSVLCVTKFL